MADLTDLDAAQTIKIVGSTDEGVETIPVNSELDSDGKGRLLVSANFDSGQLVPTITNQFKVIYSVTRTKIKNSTYTTLYQRTGVGLFFGFQAAFNNSEVKIRLKIDGVNTLDITLDDVREFELSAGGDNTRSQAGAFLTTIGSALDFSARYPIPYTSSVELAALSLNGNKENDNWIVFITED